MSNFTTYRIGKDLCMVIPWLAKVLMQWQRQRRGASGRPWARGGWAIWEISGSSRGNRESHPAHVMYSKCSQVGDALALTILKRAPWWQHSAMRRLM